MSLPAHDTVMQHCHQDAASTQLLQSHPVQVHGMQVCAALGDQNTNTVPRLSTCQQETSLQTTMSAGVVPDSPFACCMQDLGATPEIDIWTFVIIFFSFLYLFVASGILGLVFGLIAALLLKASPSNSVHQVNM